MEALIQAKVAGQEIATPPFDERRLPALNFMEAEPALRKKNRAVRGLKSSVRRGRGPKRQPNAERRIKLCLNPPLEKESPLNWHWARSRYSN